MLENRIDRPSPLALRARQHGPSAPPGQLTTHPFRVRFASDARDHGDITTLRRHGAAQGHLGAPASDALDVLDDTIRDGFVHHLVVREACTQKAAASARITAGPDLHELARSRASHFDLGSLPASHLDRSAWVDRIAVDPAVLEGGALWALLAGLHRYLDWNDLRYVLCPALVASDAPGVVAAASLELARGGAAGSRWTAPSQPDYDPDWTSPPVPASDAGLSPWLLLLRALGARVCGGPAVDVSRGMTLFLMRLDMREVEPQVQAVLPGPGCWEPRAGR